MQVVQKIAPCLWFNNEAEEAACYVMKEANEGGK